MNERDYPERLKLFKEEGEGGQDHYFLIVNEEGNLLSSKWYPIRDGHLHILVSTLSLNTPLCLRKPASLQLLEQ